MSGGRDAPRWEVEGPRTSSCGRPSRAPLPRSSPDATPTEETSQEEGDEEGGDAAKNKNPLEPLRTVVVAPHGLTRQERLYANSRVAKTFQTAYESRRRACRAIAPCQNSPVISSHPAGMSPTGSNSFSSLE